MIFYRKKKIHYSLSELGGNQGFVASLDRGTYRGFLSFDSIDEFCLWYGSLRPEEKTINEVVTSDLRKLVLDIDGPDDRRCVEILHVRLAQTRHRARVHEVFDSLDIGTPNVIAYDMCSDSRISYHFVVSNVAFSAQTCMGLCAMICHGQIWSGFVDRGVYKRTQCMRLEGSTKFGEKRWKVRVGHRGCLTDGILSDLRGTRVSDVSCSVKQSRSAANVPLPIKNPAWADFEIRKIRGNAVFLRRTRPGFCSQCNRTHDKENAMVRYDSCGRAFFLCWRFFYAK